MPGEKSQRSNSGESDAARNRAPSSVRYGVKQAAPCSQTARTHFSKTDRDRGALSSSLLLLGPFSPMALWHVPLISHSSTHRLSRI